MLSNIDNCESSKDYHLDGLFSIIKKYFPDFNFAKSLKKNNNTVNGVFNILSDFYEFLKKQHIYLNYPDNFVIKDDDNYFQISNDNQNRYNIIKLYSNVVKIKPYHIQNFKEFQLLYIKPTILIKEKILYIYKNIPTINQKDTISLITEFQKDDYSLKDPLNNYPVVTDDNSKKILPTFGKFVSFFMILHNDVVKELKNSNPGYTDSYFNIKGNNKYTVCYKIPLMYIIDIIQNYITEDLKETFNFKNIQGAYPIGFINYNYISYNIFNVKNNYYGKFCLGYKTKENGVKSHYRIIDGWSIRTGIVTGLDKTDILKKLSKKINDKSKQDLKKILKKLYINKKCNNLNQAKIIFKKNNSKKILLIKKKFLYYAYYAYDFKFDRYDDKEDASWFECLNEIGNKIDFIDFFIRYIFKNFKDFLQIGHETGYEYEFKNLDFTDNDDFYKKNQQYWIIKEFLVWREMAIEELLNPPKFN